MAHERTDSYIKDLTAIFRYYKKLGESAMAQCPDAGLVAVLDAESNSIATIVKHMAGNMISRWTDFLTTVAETKSQSRFDRQATQNRVEVLDTWDAGWKCFFATLESLMTRI